MSRRQVLTALLEVRRWTVDDVANVLQQNGLGEFVEVFKKRNIDGDSLLSLTEGMLALWNREVSLPNIRKIGNFIEDIRSEPEKYCVPLRSKPTRRRSAKTYSQTSWNTVFESDYEYQNLNATGNSYPRHSLQETIPVATYQNQIEDKIPANGDVANLPPFDIPIIPEKPPPPARPPSLKPRPKADHTAKLPVPPIPDEKQYEHLKTFISYIKLPPLEEKDLSNAVDSPVYESPDLYETSDSPSKDWGQNHESRRSPSYPSEERYSAEYESINETNSAEYYLHPSAVDTSVKPHLELSELQLRELPEAPAPPVKPKGLPSNASALLPPSTVPPRPTESKPPSAENLDRDSFDAKSERIEYVLKKVISISHHPPGSVPKKEKVTASPELKISTSSSTSSLTSVTTIKTNSGQAASLPDQRLPPNLRPLPPTPGTSSFRPPPATNAMPIPIRKTSNSKVGITQYPWYHNVDRKRGEELVFNGEDGTFLVRPSTQTQNPYTLTIWFGKRVYNIGVRFRPDGKYALGTEKQNEQSFRSVEEMVSYYQSEQLVLYSGGERTGQTALKSSPKKE